MLKIISKSKPLVGSKIVVGLPDIHTLDDY